MVACNSCASSRAPTGRGRVDHHCACMLLALKAPHRACTVAKPLVCATRCPHLVGSLGSPLFACLLSVVMAGIASVRKRRMLTFATKLEFIRLLEKGEKKSSVVRTYKILQSTFSIILKNKADIKMKAGQSRHSDAQRVRTLPFKDVEGSSQVVNGRQSPQYSSVQTNVASQCQEIHISTRRRELHGKWRLATACQGPLQYRQKGHLGTARRCEPR